MKNKKIIFMLIFIFIIITGFVVIININKSYRIQFSNSKKMILAEKAYINYAWGFQYRGKAIFNDGSIYEWDINDTHYKYNANTIEEQIKWILENGYCINEKVSEKDLEKLKENINNVKDDIKMESYGHDIGATYIVVWNSNKEKIKLRESGDRIGENNNEASQKLIKIIYKYLK